MNIHLTQHDGIPFYLQIINQIKQLIATERLSANQELPPIRVLAERLLINPNTVARAYRELEAAGWVYKKRGAGTFVAENTSPLSAETCLQQLRERVQILLNEAEHMNISTEQLIKLIRETSKSEQERRKNNAK